MNDIVPVLRISPLRQRVIDDVTMRRFSRETQRNYIRDIERLATRLGWSPHTATVEEVRHFQIEQQQAAHAGASAIPASSICPQWGSGGQ